MRRTRGLLGGWPALAVLLWAAATAAAQPLLVAGDGEHLWHVREDRPEGRGFTLLHRGRGAATRFVHRVDTFRGALVPGGLAAHQGALWLIFDDLSVQSIEAAADPAATTTGGYRFGLTRYPSLPAGVQLRSFAVGHGGAFALVRVETAAALAMIDSPPPPPPPPGVPIIDRFAEVALPPGIGAPPPPSPQAPSPPAAAAPAESPTPQPVAESRLIRLQSDLWQKVDLPVEVTADARAWLAFHPHAADWPSIVVAPPGDRAGELWVYRRAAESWSRTIYPPAWPAREHHAAPTGDLQATGVGPTLVVARRAAGDDRLTVDLVALAPEGPVALGAATLDATPPFRWALTPYAATVAVVTTPPAAAPAAARLQWTRTDTSGATVEPPATLYEHRRKPLDTFADMVLLIGALVIATLVMLVFWRRDPQGNQVELPGDLALADLGRRALAAALDLAPGIVVATLGFGIDVPRLLEFWPGGPTRTVGWESSLPALTAIAVTVAHAALGEMFTGRSIGKALLGLHVTGLRGAPVNLWQALGRNALKAVELAAPLLLILPLLGPYRQRLGDLVARTLVVSKRDPDETDLPKSKNEDE